MVQQISSYFKCAGEAQNKVLQRLEESPNRVFSGETIVDGALL